MKVKKYSQRELNKVFTFAALLDLVLKGNAQMDIARELNWSKQRTNYWIKQLEKETFIRWESRSSTKIYDVSSKGQKFLTWSKEAPKLEVFLHSVGLKFPILESSPEFDALKWREVPLKNWIKKVLKYHHIEGIFSIERNPENLIIWCQERIGADPYQLFFESFRDLLQFADNLQTKYNVKLGCPSLYRKPHFGIDEPVLAKVNQCVQVTGSNEWTDSSPFPGSVESFDPRRIVQYLRMPEKLDRYEKILREIAEQMKAFGDGMKEHMKLIYSIQDLTESLKEVADALLKTLRRMNQQ